MARDPLPKNDNPQFESDDPTVSPVSPTEEVEYLPRYPSRARLGGSSWSFAGIGDETFPSPNASGWSTGWVGGVTRRVMLDHHKVYQALNNLTNLIVGDGGRCIPAVSPYGPDKAQFPEALRNAQFATRALRAMQDALWTTTRQMCYMTNQGNKMAPIVMREQERGADKGRLVIDKLTVLDNALYDFQQDPAGNVTHARLGSITANTKRVDWPISKFFRVAWRPNDGSPYGTQVLRPAYNAYYKDVQIDYEEMSYVAQFGRPSIIIFAAPPPEHLAGAKEKPFDLIGPDGEFIMEPDPDNPGGERRRKGYQTEQNAIMFTHFQAGSIWSMEAGSLVKVVEARQGGADLYRFLREQNGRNITGVILGTHQATEAERNVSTTNVEASEGIMGLNANEGRATFEVSEERDLIFPLIRWNFGLASARDLLPIRDYGSGQNGRLPKMLNAVGTFISSGALTQDQWWWFCAANGLPLPYPDSLPITVAVGAQLVSTGGGDKTADKDKPKPKDDEDKSDDA